VLFPPIQDAATQPEITISGTGYVTPNFSALAVCLVLFLLQLPASAHDVITTKLTYNRDISRIFARRCVSCHSAKSSIPLVSYETTRPWAVAIKEQVLSRAMPPWGAVKGFGDLSPDGALSQEEILIIAAWVVGGAPEGDPATLPKTPSEISAAPKTTFTPAVEVSNQITLAKPLRLAALRPETNAASARITARLPDGRVQPLVWLYQYDARAARTFQFREPILLPQGTVVAASSPVRFALETPVKAKQRGR
jgi:hypothetical protein